MNEDSDLVEQLVQKYCCVVAGNLVPSSLVATEEALRDALKEGRASNKAAAVAVGEPTMRKYHNDTDVHQAARLAVGTDASIVTKVPPFVMSESDAVDLWNSVDAAHFEGQLIAFAAKAINFYKDATPPAAAQPSRAEWIKVKDRLPDTDRQLVVVFDPEHPELKVWPAQWDAENQAFLAGHYPSAGWFEKDEVTHWMPMPKP